MAPCVHTPLISRRFSAPSFFLPVLLVMTQVLSAQPQRCGVDAQQSVSTESGMVVVPRSEEVVHLPVVVHVVWRTTDQNLSDRQIRAQIDVLNADFRKRNTRAQALPKPFAAVAADTRIEFCLASEDPQGFPSKGITRSFTMKDNIGDDRATDGRRSLFYPELGGVAPWDPERYINIYVCDLSFLGLVPAATDTSVFLGTEDGILINYLAFSPIDRMPPYHLGTTLTHEMGHYLGLAHPWGTDPDDCLEDDGIEDTPLQGTTWLGTCPGSPVYSCGSSDMYMNFMNFTDDNCLAAFTQGQVNVMRNWLFTRRSLLLDGPPTCQREERPDTLSDGLVRVFPNPVGPLLHVEIDVAEQQELAWSIVDALGRTVLSGSRTAGDYRPIDVKSLARGWYVLILESSSGTVKCSFLKL